MTRVSFEDNNGTAKVVQENSYYAFGLIMPGSTVATPTDPNKQLYNGGAEWQNDFGDLPDLSQTFFRNYDAALSRWTGVDPEAESVESLSTYQYVANNPIMFNDPLGNKQYTVRETPEGVRDLSKQGSGGSDLYSPLEKIAAWLDGVEARLKADMYGVTVYNDGSHDDLFAKVAALFNSSIRNIANSLGYEELPGTVLPEIHVSGRGLNWNDIWSKVQDEYDNYNGYDIGSRNWAATEKQLATKKDLGEYVYKAAEFYATGEIGGELIKYGLGAAGNLLSKFTANGIEAGSYSVYQGLENGVVKYIGITSRNVAERFAEHIASGTARAGLDYEVIPGATNLTKTAARIFEQNLINHYGWRTCLTKLIQLHQRIGVNMALFRNFI